MKLKFSLLFASLLAFLIAFVPAISSLAMATPPEHFTVAVDQTQILSNCGFPIVRHDAGTLIFQDSFGSNGNVLWENAIFSDWRITFTNPANGKSITSVRAYKERFVQYEDGSFKAMSAGLVAQLVVPGQGQVVANVGVISVVFDAFGQPISFVISGEHDGAIAQFVCPYVAQYCPVLRDANKNVTESDCSVTCV